MSTKYSQYFIWPFIGHIFHTFLFVMFFYFTRNKFLSSQLVHLNFVPFFDQVFFRSIHFLSSSYVLAFTLCTIMSVVCLIIKVCLVKMKVFPTPNTPLLSLLTQQYKSGVKEISYYSTCNLLDCISDVVIVISGATRGIGLCHLISFCLGLQYYVYDCLAFSIECLNAPLLLSLHLRPYVRFMRLFLTGLTFGFGLIIAHMFFCANPDFHVSSYLQSLALRSTPYDLALRRVVLLIALERSQVQLFCRSDQKLCQKQKEILGLVTKTTEKQPVMIEKFPLWIVDLLHNYYLISRELAENFISSLPKEREFNPFSPFERENFTFFNEKKMNAYFMKQRESYLKKLSSLKSAKELESMENAIRYFVINEEFIIPRNQSFQALENFFSPPKRKFLVECFIQHRYTESSISSELEEFFLRPTRNTDISITCDRSVNGDEYRFFTYLMHGGTSPIWVNSNDFDSSPFFHSGLLNLETIESLFSKNYLQSIENAITS
jgi:hypothetical protein